MAHSESQHRVSEFLTDRHPYRQAPFPRGIFRKEVSRAFGHRAFPKLVSVLAQDDLGTDEKREALEALSALLTTQESKIRGIAAGSAAAAARRCADGDHIVRAWACVVLSQLASLAQGKRAISAAGVLGRINQLLADEHVEVRENAALIYSNLTDTREGVQLAIENEAIPSLVAALSDQDIEVVDRCLLALVAITRTDAGLCIALSADALTPLLRLSQLPELAFPVSQVLCNLVAHPQGKKEAANSGAVEALSPLLMDPDAEIRRVVSGALMHISVCEEGKVAIDEFASSNLVLALRDSNPYVVKNVEAAIRGTAEYPAARANFDKLFRAANITHK